MDADEFVRFGAMHDLVSRMSAKLGLERQAVRGDFYSHGDVDNLTDQLEAVAELRTTLDQVEAFALWGLRIGLPGAPEVDYDTIADALGTTRAQAKRRYQDARRLASSLRTPDDYEPGQPGGSMADYVAGLPDPVN